MWELYISWKRKTQRRNKSKSIRYVIISIKICRFLKNIKNIIAIIINDKFSNNSINTGNEYRNVKWSLKISYKCKWVNELSIKKLDTSKKYRRKYVYWNGRYGRLKTV